MDDKPTSALDPVASMQAISNARLKLAVENVRAKLKRVIESVRDIRFISETAPCAWRSKLRQLYPDGGGGLEPPCSSREENGKPSMTKFSRKPLSIALGAACAFGGLNAQASVFQATDLAGGYMVAAADDAKKGEPRSVEGHCGGMRMMEGRCGEGMCGGRAFDMMDENKDGKLSKDEYSSWHNKNWADGKCGAYMKMPDSQCGEGMCGGNVKK